MPGGKIRPETAFYCLFNFFFVIALNIKPPFHEDLQLAYQWTRPNERCATAALLNSAPTVEMQVDSEVSRVNL